MMRSFREYQPNERRNYITLSTDGLERYGDYVSDQTCKQVTLSLSPRCPFDVLSCDEYATLLMKSKMKAGTDK